MTKFTGLRLAALSLALNFAGTAAAQTYSKKEVITYSDNLSAWVISQTASVSCVESVPASTACDGDIVSLTTFDAGTSLPASTYSFGKLQSTASYNPDGTLASIKDGRNKTTVLSSWKLGVPRLISYADGTTKSATVSNDGWISSVTDENGYTTNYGYDAMGRIASISYPSGDSVAWAATTRSIVPVAEPEYGISAGHWRETIATGNARRVTYFDARWRPILVREYDTSEPGGERFIRTAYDAGGRVSFASYPSTSSSPTVGVWTEYDALDRPTSISEDSELSPLTTLIEYRGGFETRTTNPRNVITSVRYIAYDQPSTDWPVSVVTADAVYTTIARDPFGKLLTITRSGAGVSASRSFTYNSAQELCRSVEPEAGATLFGYDAAGNLSWSAAGLPGTSACSDTGNTTAVQARKVSRTYDNRNRLTSLTFAGGLGNQSWSYTSDGLPSQISTTNDPGGTVVNTYQYNKRRLMVSEVQQHDVYNWTVGYSYNSIGHLNGLTYPAGLTLAYTVNALGQVKRIDGGARNYARDAIYYPNGALKQFTYGNGIVHTMQQNVRQLPARVLNSGSILDYTYAYDETGNVTAIVDGARGGVYDRTMAYDAMDRLISAQSGSFGGTDGVQSFTYDALDNLTSWMQPGGRDYASYLYDPNTNRLTNIRNSSGASILAFDYDTQGNATQKNGQGYAFDIGNRMRAVVDKECYRYDGFGRRVLSDAQGGRNYSLYAADGTLLWQRDDVNGKRRQHIYLAGSRIAQRARPTGADTETVSYYHTDALGSPTAVTNDSGQIIGNMAYEPYGGVVGAPLFQGIGFAGHAMDGASGLTYMQQRYYDPQVGRFLSVDPVTPHEKPIENFNRYAYAFNNPFKFIDPDGRDGIAIRAMERDMDALAYGTMSKQEFSERSQARGAGAAIGMLVVAGGAGILHGGRWLLTTKAGKETLLAGLSWVSRSDDQLHKVGKRVHRELVAQMKQAREQAVKEAQRRAKTQTQQPPKPPKTPEPPKPHEPPPPPPPPPDLPKL